ncbi:hypothetical protein FCM35_KLT02174 [Carex littledalei]|uniref:Uncharacterized protein n=1 Tax=Carex littledalei TaxID=544730 RepID=A0A833R3L5_9POAL|nr:hypothetical protein FCM35_KLT02174 [Carex littledalei]
MSAAKVTWRNYVPKFDRATKIAPAKKSPQIQTTKTSMQFADARSQNPTSSVYVINIEEGDGVDGRAEAYIRRMYNSFSSARED